MTLSEKRKEYKRLWKARPGNKAKITKYNKMYWRIWRARPGNKAKHNKMNEKWRRENKEAWLRHSQKYKHNPKHKIKIKARSKLAWAIQSGKIKREPCQIKKCNKVGQAHHSDYKKPLEIIWLCQPHHKLLYHTRRTE